jgi:uncharacterized membrane protein YvlD (DUF360 family)
MFFVVGDVCQFFQFLFLKTLIYQISKIQYRTGMIHPIVPVLSLPINVAPSAGLACMMQNAIDKPRL